MWLNKLKIAIIEKNPYGLSELLSDIPPLESQNEIEEAIYLLREATLMMHTLRDQTQESMKQIKKNLDFLRSMDIPTSRKFDTRS